MNKINHIPGVSDFRITPVVAEIFNQNPKTSLLVTSSYSKAKELKENLSFFVKARIFLVPEEEPFLFQYEAKSREDLDERLAAIYAAERSSQDGIPVIIISPITGFVKKMPPKEDAFKISIKFEVGADIDMDEAKVKLASMGFERVPLTEEKGQFSVRGEIIDVFPVDSDYPMRIDVFDTEIETIKSFDPETQKSIGKRDSVFIYPALSVMLDKEAEQRAVELIGTAYEDHKSELKPAEATQLERRKNQLIESIKQKTNYRLLENYISYIYKDPATIVDYLPDDANIFIDDSDRLKDTLELRYNETGEDFASLIKNGNAVPEDMDSFPGPYDYDRIFGSNTTFFFTPFVNKPKVPVRISQTLEYTIKIPPHFNGHMDVFASQLGKYIDDDYKVTIVCSTDERENSLKEFISEHGFKSDIKLTAGNISTGYVIENDRHVILRDGDIFKTVRKRRTRFKDENAVPIRSFADINPGDFVVHESHGIGKYIGVEQLDAGGNKKDYLKIKYAGADLLYVPVEQMNIIQKFIGGGDKAPKVSKLAGGEWKRAKARAKKDIAAMSKELLELSAQRKTVQGYAFSPDTVWQKDFEDQFPYKETDDQLRSAASIKRDMEKPYPMDRLLCGDVGYGKTEVAARAVFKCVAEGKQAAVLVPTTILASQHYKTFKERFNEFPFEVEMLSRFRTHKQQKKIMEKLEEGKIDVIVSTHRLLSKDVRFKDLGLLVVDEEQRFGVKHKEIIKGLKKNVDVLTLSATPIPRTLHMSLVGIRDMDLIEEPPEDRYPVQTYVMEENDDIIRETIRREIDRGGQVYVVYNRVKGIDVEAQKIMNLIPEAQVTVAHGQMSEEQLENVMMDFIDKKFNVLIATTIIENGIDIQNVNTILIIDADKFGLSQLYQLRGRVGRTNRVAYAYLLHKKNKVLSEVSEKRLLAIKEFTEFGAGFKIAMRDLEIRGAGNLLGNQQSGHMMTIGYELYCKMIDDAVKALSGEEVLSEREEVTIDLPVTAYIPDTYVEDEKVKLQVYKDIAAISDTGQYEEVSADIADRFGQIPFSVNNLMKISLLKSYAEQGGFSKIRVLDKDIILEFSAKGPDGNKVEKAQILYGTRLTRKGKASPYLLYKEGRKAKIDELLELTRLFVV